jgi:hypothetical protein
MSLTPLPLSKGEGSDYSGETQIYKKSTKKRRGQTAIAACPLRFKFTAIHLHPIYLKPGKWIV